MTEGLCEQSHRSGTSGEGTEGLQGMYRGLMKYIVGIIGKLAQVWTHMKRLNLGPEAMENEQSFLSKNPHCV